MNTEVPIQFYPEYIPLIEMLTDEQRGKLLSAMIAYTCKGIDTNFSDKLLAAIFTATKASSGRAAKASIANQSRSEKMMGNQNARKRPIEKEEVIEEPADCDCQRMNILCSEDEFKELKVLLNRKSDLLNSDDRAILIALLKTNHRYNKNKDQDEPIQYSNKRCEEDLGYRESERNHLYNLLHKEGILERGLKRIGVLDNGEEMKITVYWLNEPALLSFLKEKDDYKEFLEEVKSLNDEQEEPKEAPVIEEGPEELDAELVYSTKDGLVTPAQPEKLTDTESKMLYYMREASKISSNKYRCGSKRFYCQFGYLSKYIDSKLIKGTRESLVNKGYLEVMSVPQYQGYVYKILKFPDYLKNAS